MTFWKRVLAVFFAGTLTAYGIALVVVALFLAFSIGPVTPRNYSPEERAWNQVMSVFAAGGALGLFGAAVVAIRWGFRRPKETRK